MGRRNIYLVGMMGAGKTTVGRALAQKMQMRFADTDKVLVERTGVPIATIFEIEGEDGFRRRESAVLAELAHETQFVIATGGGAVLAAGNRESMRSGGTVVYLRARVEHLWERTRHDANRPLLQTPDPRATLARLLEERDPLYREIADYIIETDACSPRIVAQRLVEALTAL